MKPRISVVINTFNEERNVSNALQSVKPWTDEIIIVDMHSEDRTTEIAHEFGAQVFLHGRMGYADPARAFAVAKATGEWILILDADELIPKALSKKLLEIAGNDEADVVVIHWLNYFSGEPLMHTDWGPQQDKHARFYKAGYLQITDVVHNFLQPVPLARVLELPYEPGMAVVHFNYIDIAHFVEKLNRYTDIEAKQAFDRGETISSLMGVYRAIRGFLRRYIKQQGYRDGWRGFYYSLLWAFYRLVTSAKLIEMRSIGTRKAILSHYEAVAEYILTEYQQDKAT